MKYYEMKNEATSGKLLYKIGRFQQSDPKLNLGMLANFVFLKKSEGL